MNDGIEETRNRPADTDNFKSWYDKESDSTDEENEETPVIEYDIISSPNDFNINTIFNFIESGVVKIPGFQRNYVWDKKRASKPIESIVMGLPIPQIFLHEESRNRFQVIDGQQRLMSIYYFIKGRFPRKEKRNELRKIFGEYGKIPDEFLHNDTFFDKFNLELPEKLPQQPNKLNGLNYETLSEFKETFRLRTIRNIIIKQVSPKDDDSSIYEIFNRLNSGGINLTPQEIRASLYHSRFYDMLYKINNLDNWRTIIGIEYPDLHTKDIEFLLRGFAMLIEGDRYTPSMTKFLNNFSKKSENFKPDLISYCEYLFKSFLKCCSRLDRGAFFSRSQKFSISIYDAVFAVICEQPFKEQGFVNTEILPEKLKELKENKEFDLASQSGTTKTSNVGIRRDYARKVLLGN